jgi:glycerophosphoryl diester phosphodiesterase
MRVLTRSVLAAVLLAGFFSAQGLEIIAHRGASTDAPENTVASMKLGYEQKADACECDVYLTKDGKLMVMHDRSTLRTTGVSNWVSHTTSTELRKLEVAQWGQWKGKGFSEKTPFLEEVLAVVPAGKKIFVELESGPEMLPEVERQLAASGLKEEQIVIIGFNYDVVTRAKALMPQYQVYYLHAEDRQTKQYPSVESLIEKALASRLDGLNLYYGFPIDEEFVRKVKKAGLKLYIWTVNDADVGRNLARLKVDGITTDRPQWLREQIGF